MWHATRPYQSRPNPLEDTGTKVFAGMDSVCSLVTGDNIDIVIASMVGFSGLEPTIAAIKAGKVIALANKETLVAAGRIVMDLASRMNVPILPVDSEHSAIFQCLMCARGNKVSKLHLTASGGPFRTWDRESIAKATKDIALKHPNWDMGAKITIDSAPMAFIAQMAEPDMREPNQFALCFPERLPLSTRKLDFAKVGSLSFSEPDPERFPALGLAFKAMERGGNIPCALNAANEAAVAAYINGRISFYGISDVVGECMEKTSYISDPSLEDIFATNDEAYSLSGRLIDEMERR